MIHHLETPLLTDRQAGQKTLPMGCMVLCSTFHSAPEQGHWPLTPTVPHCSGPSPGTGHRQSDYTI